MLLQIENLTVSYGRVPAVHHVTFGLGAGCLVGLLGPNGAGKTTLLKAIAGLLPVETGTIGLAGTRAGVAYVPQREGVDWDFPVTVRALAEMGRYRELGLWKRFRAEDNRIVDEALEVTDLLQLAGRQIKALSGGQQQRAFLARALAQQAAVYLLDEPFTGLDANASRTFAEALGRLRAMGKLVIASHHHLGSVPELFDHVVILNGELVAAGPTAEAFSDANLSRAYDTQVFTGVTR